MHSDPALAMRLWPANSLAHAALADQLLTTAPTAPPPEARRQAVAALDLEPGNPVAARVVGTSAAVEGDVAGFERWLGYSDRHSRRDIGTQLALIQLAVTRGQIDAALVHYDRALRVFSPQPELVDVLVGATNDASVRTHLAEMLRQKPPWRSGYLIQLVESNHASAEAVDTMLRALRLDPSDVFDHRILSEAVGLLASRGQVDAARSLVGLTSTGVRNGGFEEVNAYPPLDWKLASEPDLSGVIEQGLRGGGGNALFLDVRNDTSGVVAEELLTLAPGRYMLTLVAGGVAADNVLPAISIGCSSRPASLMTGVLASGMDARVVRLPVFTVPTGCPVQRLTIAATASNDASASRPWIDDVRLTPAL